MTKYHYRCEKCKRLIVRKRKTYHDRYECARTIARFKLLEEKAKKELEDLASEQGEVDNV